MRNLEGRMKRILDHPGLKPDLSGLVKLFHLMKEFLKQALARTTQKDSDNPLAVRIFAA